MWLNMPPAFPMLEARREREQTLTDDKVLADWNGLMIAACARERA